MKGLTERQEQILQFVLEYVQQAGYPPSIREIGDKFKIASLRGVTVHLDALSKKGYIERANTPRSIKVTHPSYQSGNRATLLPLLGSIAAGLPIAANENVDDMIPVPSEMVRNIQGPFLLRVRGDSMIGEGINPRDLVIVKPQKTASNNELVAVLIGDEATVKRIRYEKSGITLVASNPAYDPIPIDREDSTIIGKIVGLIRDYEGRAF